MLFSAALSTSAVTHTDLTRRELLLVDPLEGSDLLFELLSSRAHDERQGTYVVSILRNITDLARAREEIEESYRTLRVAQAEVRDERHRLDLIIDSVADPILVTDPEGDIVLMNEPAERLFNVPATAHESAQRSVRANGANLTSFVSNVLTRTGEQRYRGEIQLTDRGNRPRAASRSAGRYDPVRAGRARVGSDDPARPDARRSTRRELYERLKQASAELERKVQEATAELAQQNELLRRQHIELEQASALKSQFLANISHEFRTPLNAILGYTYMLLQGVSGDVSELQRKSLSRIDSNSRHLLALINDILDITRLEAGRMPLNVSTLQGAGSRSRSDVRARTDHPAIEPHRHGEDEGHAAGGEDRPAEGQADRAQPVEQRLEVHADRLGHDQCRVRRPQPHGHHRRAATPASGFPRSRRRRSSKTFASSTTRRHEATAAPGSACRSAAGWR